jgi:hypothetical protein
MVMPHGRTYHSLLTDIGVVQETPLSEDLPETLRKLDNFLPYNQSQIMSLSKEIHRLKCRLIICDISPMGIAVAQKAGIPSVLVENFTWDWVYENYVSTDFPACKFIDYLREIYSYVDYHILAVIRTLTFARYRSAERQGLLRGKSDKS